ncbi:MAG: hypothetical protein HKP61_00395 [Dactylosporangium sp.]|nr:cellulose-binding domain-containing protein [Dactylosporangium sp.]NNJ59431.1 hypothetical protein [Dactylosporangium sp.]
MAILAVAVTGVVGGILATERGASAATGCSVDYAVTSQWAGGFVASVSVTNLGSAVTGWTVAWSFGAGQEVVSAWNAAVSQSGAQVTASDLGYNGDLGDSASASFGFQGAWTGTNPAPAGFTLNGVACADGAATPSATITTLAPSVSTSPAPAECPAAGHITYTLSRATNPTAAQTAAYDLITTAMDQAVGVYNCHTNITKALYVSYDPSVATADGNQNGSIRFGATSTMQQITAMHEIGHTVGVGASTAWSSLVVDGVWTGANATGRLRAITGDQSAILHADAIHFWPYGLNYTSEVSSSADLVAHCAIVVALRQDMGM